MKDLNRGEQSIVSPTLWWEGRKSQGESRLRQRARVCSAAGGSTLVPKGPVALYPILALGSRDETLFGQKATAGITS